MSIIFTEGRRTAEIVELEMGFHTFAEQSFDAAEKAAREEVTRMGLVPDLVVADRKSFRPTDGAGWRGRIVVLLKES